jgi:hypothetical protein
MAKPEPGAAPTSCARAATQLAESSIRAVAKNMIQDLPDETTDYSRR